MSLAKKPSKDTSGEPGATRRDALILVQTILLLFCSVAMSFSGLAIGTTTSKVTLGQQTDYTVDGRNLRKAATPDCWTLSGAGCGVSSFVKYLLLLDSSGVATAVECPASKVSAAAVAFPDLFVTLDSKCLVGVLVIATDGVTSFVPGTTALNAAGITATYLDGLDTQMLKLLVDESNIAYKA